MTAVRGRQPVTPPSEYAAAWRQQAAELDQAAPAQALGLGRGEVVLVLGAHPDDETFGLGATIAQLAFEGVEVHIVTMTVGEAALSHMGKQVPGLPSRRHTEFERACAALGAASWTIVGLPDSGLAARADDVHAVVSASVRVHAPVQLLTTWWRDPHEDHAVVGEAARRVAADTGCGVFGYPIWAQHWSDPALLTEAASVTMSTTSPAARDARAAATACYSSQTTPLADDLEAILPADMLAWDLELLVGT